MIKFQEWLGAISGYKAKYEALVKDNQELSAAVEVLFAEAQGCLDSLDKVTAQLTEARSQLVPSFDLGPVVKHDGVWVDNALAKAIPAWGMGVSRVPLDGLYRIPSLEDTQAIIAWDLTDKETYVANIFDCENFALRVKARVDELFKVNHFGLVIDWSSSHAYNVFLTPEGRVFLYEGQNDEYWDLAGHDFKGSYALQSAVILI